MHIQQITLTLKPISIESVCDSYSAKIYKPTKSNLIDSIDTSSHCYFFVAFNSQYQNMTTYGIWFESQLKPPTQQEKTPLGIKLSKFPFLTLNPLKQCIKCTGTKYS